MEPGLKAKIGSKLSTYKGPKKSETAGPTSPANSQPKPLRVNFASQDKHQQSLQQVLQNRELPKQASRFHSPKIERYKNLVDHYKKTLETLSRQGGEHINGGIAVKHSLEFLLNKKQ
jgi:hypothetical protein